MNRSALRGSRRTLTLSLSLGFSIELDEAPLVQTAASLFRDMCYRYREELMAGIIVAGWDKRKGGQVRVQQEQHSQQQDERMCSSVCVCSGVHRAGWRDDDQAAGVGRWIRQQLHLRICGFKLQSWNE